MVGCFYKGHAEGDKDAVARSRTPICLMCVPEGLGGTDIYRRLQQGKVG